MPRMSEVASRQAVTRWMKQHKNEFETATALAESAAITWQKPEWLDDDQHWIWDVAIDVLPTE